MVLIISMISTLTNATPLLLLRIVLGILWRLQTCQRHRESSSLYFLDFPTVQLMLQSIPNVPRESQNVCLVELFSILMLSFHISEQKDRQQVSKQTFLFFQICQKQQFNMSQKCIRSWKMYLQSLTIIDFPTLCANQMCAKKWVEESFIINLWKQRLVLTFFAFFFFPVGMWFVGVGQYLSCVKERDYSLTGKSCLQSTSCLFWNIQRWDAFFALLQWMTHFMRKICIWKMIFFQIKVWPCPMPI